MRVAAVIHYAEFGGPHNQILGLARPLADHGVGLVCALPEGPGADRLAAGDVDVRHIPLGRFRATLDPRVQARMAARVPIDLIGLTRLFRKIRPDVVQLSSLMNPHAAYVAKAMGIPVVWQIVDTRPPLKARKAMMWQIGRLADVVMPIGRAVRDAHPGASDFGERCILFFPPVDLQAFRPDGPATLRGELGIPAGAPIVTVIGNINPQKGHEHFIDAAASVVKARPDARFVVVGHLYDNHRAYFDALQDRAARLGLRVGDNLHFLGARTDVADILRSSDVFALASVPNSEGMPTVILEAMACGVPVVATDVASVSEVVEDGATGYVVPSLDPAAMATSINDLLRDPDRRRAFSIASRQKSEERFSLETYTETHLRAYDLAIAHRRTAKGTA